MGLLYVVATPIGNLEDITLRALRVLGEVGLIAAEDTRSAHTLLSHHGISTPVTSYYEHNKLAKLETILAPPGAAGRGADLRGRYAGYLRPRLRACLRRYCPLYTRSCPSPGRRP